jgi:hypothetical protein
MNAPATARFDNDSTTVCPFPAPCGVSQNVKQNRFVIMDFIAQHLKNRRHL